jgi:GTPase SAR1 family protein
VELVEQSKAELVPRGEMISKQSTSVESDVQSPKSNEAFVIVYSITDRQSFDHVQFYYDAIVAMGGTNPTVIIVGNKTDLESSRQVSTSEGKAFARRLRVPFIETSATQKGNLDELFETLLLCDASVNDNEFAKIKAAWTKLTNKPIPSLPPLSLVCLFSKKKNQNQDIFIIFELFVFSQQAK